MSYRPKVKTDTSGNTQDFGLDADTVDGKHASDLQDKLVSGTNIKTVNGNSLLGSGDLDASRAKSLLSYSAGGTDDITALQNAFDHIDKSVGTAVRLEHGTHYMSFGYALDGYSYEHAYGSFIVLGYGLTNPTYVRMQDGTWNSSSLALTSDIPDVSGKLDKTGGEMTGTLAMNGNRIQLGTIATTLLEARGTLESDTARTLPTYGGQPIVMQTAQGRTGDIGVLWLSEDNAFICNSSDNGYTFCVFDTDLTTDFSDSIKSSFGVRSNGAGIDFMGTMRKVDGSSTAYTYTFPNKSGTIATINDVPVVYNPTITFTQGGTTKGSITLNQSSNQTITLDGGSSGATLTLLWSGSTTSSITGLDTSYSLYLVSTYWGVYVVKQGRDTYITAKSYLVTGELDLQCLQLSLSSSGTLSWSGRRAEVYSNGVSGYDGSINGIYAVYGLK